MGWCPGRAYSTKLTIENLKRNADEHLTFTRLNAFLLFRNLALNGKLFFYFLPFTFRSKKKEARIMSPDTALVNPGQAAPGSAAAAVAVMNSSLVPDKYGDADFDNLAKIGDYLPYLKLCGSNTEEAKRGLIPIGNHALIRGKALIDMGKTVNVWICAWRPYALLTAGEKPISFTDPNSEGFKQVVAEAQKPGLNNALAGPQFLLFIPGQGFATYFLSSKTAKNEAANFKALIDKCAIIGSKFIENKSYSWHGPTVVESSQQFGTPEQSEYLEALENFKNPKEPVVKLADKAPEGEKREM